MRIPAHPPEHRLHWIRIPVVLYAHPLELSLGVALFFTGARSLYNSAVVPNTLEEASSSPVVVAWQLGTIVASVGMVLGCVLRERRFWRAIERASCYGIASVAAAYAVALAASGEPAATFSAAALGAIACGLVLRAGAIRVTERVIREQIAIANDDAVARDALLRLVDGRPPVPPDQGARGER